MNAADARSLQLRLGVVQDGAAGPLTYGALLERLKVPVAIRGTLAGAMAPEFAAAGISTRLRAVHFLAQVGHESEGFVFLTELGGPNYCARYDGRADLGNTQPGDGYRYRGRGLIQLTGRANYRAYGAKLGLDLEGNPALAAEPATALKIACLYWRDHGCNALADADDINGVTRKVNGGLNGLADRTARLRELKALWP
jgi:putative chitinase